MGLFAGGASPASPPPPPQLEPPVLVSLPLSMDNLLLRGCTLRNSDFVLGVVLYAGHDSRIMRNARAAPFKARRR